MRQSIKWITCGAIVAVLGSAAVTAQNRRTPGDVESQIRRMPSDPEKRGAAMQVSLTAGGQRYESSAPGHCTHAPTASIYGVVSELWKVEQQDNDKSLNFTLWQPKDGSRPMVSLTVTSGKASHRVNTVRGGTIAGSAKANLEPSGKGGTFTIYAKSAAGADIMGTVKCDAFAPHIAEGGL